MSEASHVDNNEGIRVDDVPDEQNIVDPGEGAQSGNSLRAALRKFFSSSQPGAAVRKRDLKLDRTRSLLLLIGGIVGAVLLFVGVFSTPPAPLGTRERAPVRPNLGHRELAGTTQLRSMTPLLNAQPQQDEYGQDRVNAEDVTNTSRRGIAENDRLQEVPLTPGQARRTREIEEGIVYRPTGRTMTKSVGVGPVGAELVRAEPNSFYAASFSPPILQTPLPATTVVTPKSSLVFVRTSVATTGEAFMPSAGSFNIASPPLLPPGSRLIARLESAVTSALKVPVVAAIEYNYERDGMIVIPAGTKAIGDLRQASISGYVEIAFHALQMPNGRTEKIDALAMGLQNEPLKGKVTGTNNGRKFITRSLSGVGTIAAYVVGAGGSTLGQPISSETLLRDRLASNITSAGEQELTNAAFSQNIVVTVPAQTRLYIVFQKAAVEPAADSSGRGAIRNSGPELPTVQELRELLDLRREINRIYEASAQMNPAKP